MYGVNLALQRTIVLVMSFLVWGGWSGMLLAQGDAHIPVMDLRDHDWTQQPTIPLAGTWAIHLDQPKTTDPPKPYYPIQVPGSWAEQGLSETNHTTGTYRLNVLLNPDHPRGLAIYLNEVLTAYQLLINGNLVGSAGQLGQDLSTSKAEFAPAIFALPRTDTIQLEVRCANFRHRQIGMAEAPIIGDLDHLVQAKRTTTVMGGILIGLLLMSCAYLFLSYFQRRQDSATLYAGLATLILAFHYLLLHERL
ncbi:MAG: hypothetical protein U0176_21600, partial [Bacteroidia bacterium]